MGLQAASMTPAQFAGVPTLWPVLLPAAATITAPRARTAATVSA